MPPFIDDPGESSHHNGGAFGLSLWYDGSVADLDIVFVHGLMGHNEKTWKLVKHDDDELVPWPRALLPKVFPRSRILSFGYDAQVVKKNGRQITSKLVGDHAKELVYLLGHHRLKTKTIHRPIIFVCHSLGGLVCKDAILHSKVQSDAIFHDVYESTSSVVFMGTPHTGSAIAHFAEAPTWLLGQFLQTNKRLLELLKTNSEVLGRIHEDFCLAIRESKSGQPIELVCFWEELKSGSFVIVPKTSATIVGYRSRGIRQDHGGIVKFTGESDPGYISFVEELTWLIDKTITSTVPSTSPRFEDHEYAIPASQYPAGPANGSPPSPPPQGPYFMIPYSKNDVFIGRTSNLQQLHNWLGSPIENQRQGIHRRAALHGLGGVGKTQVSLQWAYELQQKHPYLSIFWVHASTTDRIIESYSTIASTCQIPNCKPDDPLTLPKVRQWLSRSNTNPWLMIVDNADDIDVFYKQDDEETSSDPMAKYLPDSPSGTILFTTRSKRAALNLTRGRNLFVVEEPTTQECVQMMQARLPNDMYTEVELEILADHLGNLPLAMVQATSYLQLNSLSVSKYLERLKDSGEDALIGMLENEFEEAGRDMGTDQRVPNAVAKTWLMSFQNIERQDPLAIEILNLCGCFDRQEIPRSFFEEYQRDYEWYNELLFSKDRKKTIDRNEDREGQNKQPKKKQWRKSISTLKSHFKDLMSSKKEPDYAERVERQPLPPGPSQPHRFGMLPHVPTMDDIDKALALLMTYSFIAQGRDEHTFTLHRLVHLVIKKRLMRNRQMAEFSTKSMSILKVILHPVRYDWPQVRKLRPHVDSVFACEPMRLDCTAAAEEKVSILVEMGEFLFFSGTHREQGIEMFREAVEIRQRVLGRTNDLTVRIHADLIYYEYLYTDPAYGALLLDPLMTEASQALGESHHATLWVVRRLADIYYEGRQYDKAAQLHDRYIDKTMTDKSKDNQDDITAIGFRRNSLGLQGRLREALALSRWVLSNLHNERPNEICDILALTWLVLVAAGEEEEGLAILSMLAFLNDQRYGKTHAWSIEAQRKLTLGRELRAKGESIRCLDDCIEDFVEAEGKVARGEMEKAPLGSAFIRGIAEQFEAGQAMGDRLPERDWRHSWAWTRYNYFKDDWMECSRAQAADRRDPDAVSILSGSTVDQGAVYGESGSREEQMKHDKV